MTQTEIRSEVQRLLQHMGCASVLQIAQELPAMGGSVRSREPAVKRALRDLGASGRKLGGFRYPVIGPRGRAVLAPRVEYWTTAGWRTASGTNIAPPVQVDP